MVRRAIGLLVAAASSAALLAGPETYASRLARAARGEFDAGLMLNVECQTKAGPRSANLYGEGTGVWNERTAFSVARDRISAVLAMLDRSRFAEMPERFGGREAPALPRPKGGIVVTCRIMAKLDDGGNEKEVVQLETGQQSQPFRQLALDILQSLERSTASGVTPRSLAEALTMVADGELSPATLEIVAAHGGDKAAAARATRWMLTATGGLLEMRVQDAQQLSDALRVRPDPASLRQLARVLAESAFATLPANIFAVESTDLEVRVLAWRKSIQARQFAGASTNVKDGPDQQRLQRIVHELRALQTHARRPRPVER